MLTAWITDQHFGVRGDSNVFLDNFEKFYSQVFFPYLEKHKIKTVVNLGDTWENRRNVNVNTFYRARKMFFDELKRRGIKMYMIYGNHDVFYRTDNEVNLVDFLENMYDNIEVIRGRRVVDLGVDVGLISWIHKNNLDESLDWLRDVKADVIGGHFEINGFEMTKGQLATHGMDAELFKRFDAVYSGHFHVRSKQGNIQYLSNPSQTTWGDYGLEKGFHVFDSKDLSMTPVNNPFDMFREITWGEQPKIDDSFKDQIVRIHVKSFADVKRAELDAYIHELSQYASDIKTFEETATLDHADVASSKSISTISIIDGYIEDVVGQSENINAQRLKAMFAELYDEATSLMEEE